MKSQNSATQTKSGRASGSLMRFALSVPGKLLLAFAVMLSLVSLPLWTQANEATEKRTLTGNWMVTVTPSGSPAPPPFLTLVTYFADENLSQDGTGNFGLRGSAHGSWERIGHQQFTQSLVFFRFDAARTYIGTRVVKSTITLSDDGEHYLADSIGQNFDSSGKLLSTSGATEVAQRLF